MFQYLTISAEPRRTAKQNRGRVGFGPGNGIARVGESEKCDFRRGYRGGVGEGGGREVEWEGRDWWDEVGEECEEERVGAHRWVVCVWEVWLMDFSQDQCDQNCWSKRRRIDEGLISDDYANQSLLENYHACSGPSHASFNFIHPACS